MAQAQRSEVDPLQARTAARGRLYRARARTALTAQMATARARARRGCRVRARRARAGGQGRVDLNAKRVHSCIVPFFTSWAYPRRGC